ncbi:MAG: hypothetical protein PHC86_01125 [Eubacteriales bacterium]|nr:hypothetical protein [Eubacteriales bacterium]
MKKIKVGDIFGISTNRGHAVFQYVANTKDNCDLIRILPGFFQSLSFDFQEIVRNQEMYFIHFPLQAALNKKLVTYIGYYELPQGFVVPKHFRVQTINPRNGESTWYIREENKNGMQYIDVLSDEIIALSDWCVWNDTLLRERIEENWSLQNWR